MSETRQHFCQTCHYKDRPEVCVSCIPASPTRHKQPTSYITTADWKKQNKQRKLNQLKYKLKVIWDTLYFIIYTVIMIYLIYAALRYNNAGAVLVFLLLYSNLQDSKIETVKKEIQFYDKLNDIQLKIQRENISYIYKSLSTVKQDIKELKNK